MVSENGFHNIKRYYFKLLPTLSESSWKVYEQILTPRTFKKGEYILRAGSICNYGSYINKGLVRMYYLVDGKEHVAGFFNEDTTFSDYQSFLTRNPSVLYIQALEDTEVLDISYESAQYLYTHVPESEKLGRLLAEYLFILQANRISSLLLQSPEERYQKLIDERPFLFQRVPQYMIASYLGVTPEALSRIRRRLNKK